MKSIMPLGSYWVFFSRRDDFSCLICTDGPGSRCGHTLTSMAEVREEGSLGYIGPRLILFGGATELEGNSGTAMPSPSPIGSAGIRAMADVHCYDVLPNNWSRLTPLGEPPSPRAAPVATTVGMMVVIKGGIGPAGLSTEDLHVLDLTQQRPRWHRFELHPHQFNDCDGIVSNTVSLEIKSTALHRPLPLFALYQLEVPRV